MKKFIKIFIPILLFLVTFCFSNILVACTNKEPFSEQSWTDSYKIYKVGLNIQIKPERMQELINWNGQSIRWISIIKSDNVWRISSIATGP